jgi:hypothetical protein
MQLHLTSTNPYRASTCANALSYGASEEEIMEVLELVSVLGIHACTLGVTILLEEIACSPQGD